MVREMGGRHSLIRWEGLSILSLIGKIQRVPSCVTIRYSAVNAAGDADTYQVTVLEEPDYTIPRQPFSGG